MGEWLNRGGEGHFGIWAEDESALQLLLLCDCEHKKKMSWGRKESKGDKKKCDRIRRQRNLPPLKSRFCNNLNSRIQEKMHNSYVFATMLVNCSLKYTFRRAVPSSWNAAFSLVLSFLQGSSLAWEAAVTTWNRTKQEIQQVSLLFLLLMRCHEAQCAHIASHTMKLHKLWPKTRSNWSHHSFT